jgi:hypothetical protein
MYSNEPQIIRVMAMHLAHVVTVNGWEREVTRRSLEPDNATMAYGGYAVDCVTCKRNLSQQWH